MKTYKPFKTLVSGKSSLASVAKESRETLVAVMTKPELETNPPEWYKAAAENDSFLEDLKTRKSAWLYHQGKRILLATHEDKKLDSAAKQGKAARSLAVKTVQALRASKVKHANWFLSEKFDVSSLHQFVNASILMNYEHSRKENVFADDLTEEDKQEQNVEPVLLDHMQFHTPHEISNEQKAESDFYITAANCALFGRDIINARGSEADPEFMEHKIRSLTEGQKHIAEVITIKGDELRDQGMGLFYAVGKSATKAPRLVAVQYRGNPDSTETDYAIVGKGLTYDTGGLNLKPTGYMEDMYCDKGGAVAAMGALKGAIDLQLPINVVFAFGIAENAIDAKSYKPGDILTSLKGFTVNVGNTDAEGRLVLADTMTWTQRKYRPKRMVDLATLTGACKVALGNNIAGVFTNNEDFVKQYKASGESVFEDHWHLPIQEEHREGIKGDIANLDNRGKGVYGGASKAAAFLENFVEKDTHWVHCDIAGPAYLDKPCFPMPAHGTGFGIQTLLKLLKDHKN